MTYFNGVTLRNPIQLQAAGNWNYSGQVYHGSQTMSLAGGFGSRRGTFHLGANYVYNTVLCRNTGSAIVMSVGTSNNRTGFSSTTFSPATSTRTCALIYSLHHFDGYMWVLGQQGVGSNFRPFMAALADGINIPTTASASWVDRGVDTPFGSNPAVSSYLRRTPSGALYFLCSGPTTNNVMTAASTSAAVSTGFSSVGSFSSVDGIFGYGINTDASIQMMSTSSGTARSTNSGASWANTMSFGVTVSGLTEFRHCPKFGSGRWCCSSLQFSGKGLWYTDDNGSSWTRSTMVGGGSTVNLAFTLIEKLDPDGEVLLGFYGIAPCQVYISLNGGKEWAFLTSVIPPYFDNVGHPEIANEALFGCILVNDGSRLALYSPGATGDEGVFVSDMLNTPAYNREPGDPRSWSP